LFVFSQVQPAAAGASTADGATVHTTAGGNVIQARRKTFYLLSFLSLIF
jgi:hypothetical protein